MKTNQQVRRGMLIALLSLGMLTNAMAGTAELQTKPEPEPDPTSVKPAVSLMQEVKVFPTANNGNFTVEISTKSCEDIDVEIIDPTGKLVLAERLTGVTGQVSKNYNLGFTMCGLYFIKITQTRESMRCLKILSLTDC